MDLTSPQNATGAKMNDIIAKHVLESFDLLVCSYDSVLRNSMQTITHFIYNYMLTKTSLNGHGIYTS